MNRMISVVALAGVACTMGAAGAGAMPTDGAVAMPYGGEIHPVSVRSLRTGQVHYFDRGGGGTRNDLNPVYDVFNLPGARSDRNYAWLQPGDYPGGGATGTGSLWTARSGHSTSLPRPAPPHPTTTNPTSISFEEYFAHPNWDAQGPVMEMQFGFGVENPNPFPSSVEVSWLFFSVEEDPTYGNVVSFRDGVTLTYSIPASTASVFTAAPVDLTPIGGLEIDGEGIVLRDYPVDLLILDGLGVFWPFSAGDVGPNGPVFPHPSELIQVGDNLFDQWAWIGAQDVNPANDAQAPYQGDPNTISYLDVVLSSISPADPADPAPVNWAYATPAGQEYPYTRLSSAFPLVVSAEFEPFAGCGPADINEDGEVDIQDFFLFLQWFEDQDPRADLNQDNEIDIQDFFIFLDLFELGCTN